MQWGIVVYGTVIIFLFINFYVHAYIRPSKSKVNSKVKIRLYTASNNYLSYCSAFSFS